MRWVDKNHKPETINYGQACPQPMPVRVDKVWGRGIPPANL